MLIKLLIIAVMLLLATVVVLIKIDRKQSKENKEIKENLEVLEGIYEKNQKINTGDDVTDFNNSLDLLQEYSKKRS